MNRKMTVVAMACSLAFIAYTPMRAASAANATPAPRVNREELADSQNLVSEATRTLEKIKSDPQVEALLQSAKGIFIVPNYGRGAFLVGGQGGEGVMVAREDGNWSDPVFYHIAGISVGAQFGAEGGQIAMLLLTDRAVDSFKKQNNFSLNADAGLTIIDYSARAGDSMGKGDVVFWSDTEGAYAGASLSATDIRYDNDANRAYYRASNLSAERILSGQIMNPRPRAAQLKFALPAS